MVERMNHAIVERIKCLLSHVKLSEGFWGEEMRIKVDLINLDPLITLNGDVPKKVWTGKKVSYGYLRVFRCRAFIHISKD